MPVLRPVSLQRLVKAWLWMSLFALIAGAGHAGCGLAADLSAGYGATVDAHAPRHDTDDGGCIEPLLAMAPASGASRVALLEQRGRPPTATYVGLVAPRPTAVLVAGSTHRETQPASTGALLNTRFVRLTL